MQNPNRPSPAILAQRRVATVPFEIKSPLTVLREQAVRCREEGSDPVEYESAAARLEAEGAIGWSVRGERLARLGAVEGHQVASLQEDLVARFILEKEPLFGFDVEQVSRNQCRSVAIVHTAIVKIEGGDLYNPEELLSMPFTALSDLWLALLDVGMAAMRGNATTETNPA